MTPETDIRRYKRHLGHQQIVRRTPVTFGSVWCEWWPIVRVALIVLITTLYIAAICNLCRADDNESTSLPDAPSAVYMAVKAALPPAPPAHQDENWLARAVESKPAYRGSQLFLVGATAYDAVRTYQGLTHPTHLTGSYYDTSQNVWEYPVVDLTKQFSEGGWAKVFGPRNAAGVVGANVAVSAATLLISHELAKKGPRWRAVATALNSGRGAGCLYGALSWRNPVDYAKKVQADWGYPVQALQWKP